MGKSKLVPLLYEDIIRKNKELEQLCKLQEAHAESLRQQIKFLEEQIEELKGYIARMHDEGPDYKGPW